MTRKEFLAEMVAMIGRDPDEHLMEFTGNILKAGLDPQRFTLWLGGEMTAQDMEMFRYVITAPEEEIEAKRKEMTKQITRDNTRN